MSTMNILSITLIALILGCILALVVGVRAASAQTDAQTAIAPVPTAQVIAAL